MREYPIPGSKFENEDLRAYADVMSISVTRIEVKYLALELIETRERIARLEAQNKALLDTLNWIGTTRASAWDYVEAARQTIKEMNSAAITQAKEQE